MAECNVTVLMRMKWHAVIEFLKHTHAHAHAHACTCLNTYTHTCKHTHKTKIEYVQVSHFTVTYLLEYGSYHVGRVFPNWSVTYEP